MLNATMKYNITEKKEKNSPLSYRRAVTPEVVEDIAKGIITRLMIEQKYRDPKYNAKLLAQDLGVNMRSISAVLSIRFQQNYAELVSKMRIMEAKYMLQGRSFDNMKVEDIATNVGFTTRQSFYAAFYKICGVTPKEYRIAHGFIPKADLPPAPKPKKKASAKKKTKKVSTKKRAKRSKKQ